ncbi:MAG: hypothetical protein ACOYU0_05005 [Nitrospirota bacterium]
MRVIAPEYEVIELSALFEMDFYGGTSPEHGAENKPIPLIRHAFIEGKYDTWGFLAGQTHDPISLQGPDTLDYFYRWDCGNIGYRRPQIRIGKDWPVSDGRKLFTQSGVMRTVADNFAITKEDVLQKGGEDAGWPTTWARLGYSMSLFNKELLIALSGHYGKEEVRFGDNDHQYFKTWSGNLEVVIPLPKGLSIKGEGFIGKNLDAYLGGIGQGVNRDLRRAIRAAGGWVQLGWEVNPKLRFNAGYSIDNPKDSDLNNNVNKENRSLNISLWGNVYYNILPKLTVALEVSKWRTEYKNGPDGDNLRTHLATIYKF